LNQVRASLPDGTQFDFVVHSGTDRFISERIKTRGSWEPFETRIMVSLLRPGDVVLDVGANIGWHTVVLGIAVGPEGRVYACEPEAANASLIEQNISLSKLTNVSLFRCALSNTSGTIKFIKSASNMGDHRIDTGDGADTVEVPVDTLDNVAKSRVLRLDRTRIVKVDTQGAEFMMFDGARKTLAELPRDAYIFVEFSPNLLRKHGRDSPEKFIELLASMRRDLYMINSRYRTLHRLSEAELRKFAGETADSSEDAGLDLILAPDSTDELRPFFKIYGFAVKKRFVRRITG
jgi:FkbM family methyltransferase